MPVSAMHVVFGGGPVGAATAEALAAGGERVRVVTRGGRPALPDGVELVHGDARDPAFTAAISAGATAVYQCLNAPYDRWPADFPPLQRGVLAGARAAGARLVTLENLYGYGPVDGPLTEDLPLVATTRKGAVRAEMTRELLAAHAAGDVAVAIGRAADYVGPGVRYSALGERFFHRALAGRAVQLIGDPGRLHSLSYVADVGRGLAVLGTTTSVSALGRAWHLPVAPAWTMRQVAAYVGERLGRAVPVQRAPDWVLRVLGWFDPVVGEVREMAYQFDRDFVVDDAPFRAAFGVGATALPDALDAALAWYAGASASAAA